MSDREHGRRTGVSNKTAASVRSDLEESEEIPHFSERVDPRTGKASQPATKTRASPPPATEPEEEEPWDDWKPDLDELYEDDGPDEISEADRESESRRGLHEIWTKQKKIQRLLTEIVDMTCDSGVFSQRDKNVICDLLDGVVDGVTQSKEMIHEG